MEGYLFKRPDALSRKRKWSKYWFLLKNGAFSRYDSFDADSGAGVNLRDVNYVSNAVIKKEEISGRNYCISIKFAKDGKVWVLEAQDSRMGRAWLEELRSEAAPPETHTMSMESSCTELGLSSSTRLSVDQVESAFNDKAFTAAPTNNALEKLSRAKNHLLKILEWQDFATRNHHQEYSVSVMKSDSGDIGITFSEQGSLKKVHVKSVSPDIQIVEPIGAVVGVGDLLYKINGKRVFNLSASDIARLVASADDAVSTLEVHSLNRVHARLADHRVQVGSVVKLSLLRLIKRTHAASNEGKNGDDSSASSALGDDIVMRDSSFAEQYLTTPDLHLTPNEPQPLARSLSRQLPNSTNQQTIAKVPAVLNLSGDGTDNMVLYIQPGDSIEQVVQAFLVQYGLPDVLLPVLVSHILAQDVEPEEGVPVDDVDGSVVPEQEEKKSVETIAEAKDDQPFQRTPSRTMSRHSSERNQYVDSVPDGHADAWLISPIPETASSKIPPSESSTMMENNRIDRQPLSNNVLPSYEQSTFSLPEVMMMYPVNTPQRYDFRDDDDEMDEELSFNMARRSVTGSRERQPLQQQRKSQYEDDYADESFVDTSFLRDLKPTQRELNLGASHSYMDTMEGKHSDEGRDRGRKGRPRSRSLSPMSSSSTATGRRREGQTNDAFLRLYKDAERIQERKKNMAKALEQTMNTELWDASFIRQLSRSPTRSRQYDTDREIARRVTGQSIGEQIYDSHMAWLESNARKRQSLQSGALLASEQAEAAECTFQPKISTRPSMQMPRSESQTALINRLHNAHHFYRTSRREREDQDDEDFKIQNGHHIPQINSRSRKLAEKRHVRQYKQQLRSEQQHQQSMPSESVESQLSPFPLHQTSHLAEALHYSSISDRDVMFPDELNATLTHMPQLAHEVSAADVTSPALQDDMFGYPSYAFNNSLSTPAAAVLNFDTAPTIEKPQDNSEQSAAEGAAALNMELLSRIRDPLASSQEHSQVEGEGLTSVRPERHQSGLTVRTKSSALTINPDAPALQLSSVTSSRAHTPGQVPMQTSSHSPSRAMSATSSLASTSQSILYRVRGFSHASVGSGQHYDDPPSQRDTHDSRTLSPSLYRFQQDHQGSVLTTPQTSTPYYNFPVSAQHMHNLQQHITGGMLEDSPVATGRFSVASGSRIASLERQQQTRSLQQRSSTNNGNGSRIIVPSVYDRLHSAAKDMENIQKELDVKLGPDFSFRPDISLTQDERRSRSRRRNARSSSQYDQGEEEGEMERSRSRSNSRSRENVHDRLHGDFKRMNMRRGARTVEILEELQKEHEANPLVKRLIAPTDMSKDEALRVVDRLMGCHRKVQDKVKSLLDKHTKHREAISKDRFIDKVSERVAEERKRIALASIFAHLCRSSPQSPRNTNQKNQQLEEPNRETIHSTASPDDHLSTIEDSSALHLEELDGTVQPLPESASSETFPETLPDESLPQTVSVDNNGMLHSSEHRVQPNTALVDLRQEKPAEQICAQEAVVQQGNGAGDQPRLLDVSRADPSRLERHLRNPMIVTAMEIVLDSFLPKDQRRFERSALASTHKTERSNGVDAKARSPQLITEEEFVQRASHMMSKGKIVPLGYILSNIYKQSARASEKVLSTDDREAAEVRDKPLLSARKTSSLVKDRYKNELQRRIPISDYLFSYQDIYTQRAEALRKLNELKEQKENPFVPQLYTAYVREVQQERRRRQVNQHHQPQRTSSCDSVDERPLSSVASTVESLINMSSAQSSQRVQLAREASQNPLESAYYQSSPKFRSIARTFWADPADNSCFKFPPEVFAAPPSASSPHNRRPPRSKTRSSSVPAAFRR